MVPHPIAGRLILADGKILDRPGYGYEAHGPLVFASMEVNPHRRRLIAANTGQCGWLNSTWVGGHLEQIARAGLFVPPGWYPEDSAERGIVNAGWRHEGLAAWAVMDHGDRHPFNPLIPESMDMHCLEGGQSVWWDIVDGGELEPDRATPTAQKALAACGIMPHVQVPAAIERLRSLWRFTPDSPNLRPAVPDLGWWLYNAGNWFTDGGLVQSGWKDWGAIHWAEGHSAHHYDPEQWAVALFLRTGDLGAWRMAYLLARQKAQASFIASLAGGDQSAWRYEKDGISPDEDHSWDTGFVVVAHLSGDPGLLAVAKARGDFLVHFTPDVRYWGIRELAWHLQNLRGHYLMTGEERFKDKAQKEIDRAFGLLRPGETHWPEDGVPGWWYPWMDCMVGTALWEWRELGIGIQHETRALSMLAEACDIGTRPVDGGFLQGAMIHGTREVWQSPRITSWFLPALWILLQKDRPRWQDRYDEAMNTCTDGLFRGWGNISATISELEQSFAGSQNNLANPKMFGGDMHGTRDQFIVG